MNKCSADKKWFYINDAFDIVEVTGEVRAFHYWWITELRLLIPENLLYASKETATSVLNEKIRNQINYLQMKLDILNKE